MSPSPPRPERSPRSTSWWGNRLKKILRLKTGTVLGILAIAIFLLIAPVLMVQQQRLQASYKSAQNQVDSLLWLVYQIEREHSRMRVTWRDTMDSPTPQALQSLALRYEIFVSRFLLIKESPTLEPFRQSKEYVAVFDRLQKFVTAADPVMAGMAENPVNTPSLLGLLDQANSDEEALRDLSNHATSVVYNEIDNRNTTIESQGLWILGLVSVQLLLLSSALVGLALFVRRQRKHNLQLLKLTRSLRTARSKALGASKAKSVFLANMSHELRTPFQGLLGMLSLLSYTRLNTTQQDYTHTALKSAQHLLGILNDILDVSSVETGQIKLRPGAVNLPELLGQVQALMVVAAHEKNLALTVQLAPDVPHWIQADATRLSQILFNLVGNAIKFTDTGQVALHCSRQLAAADGAPQGLRIQVSDSGIGMDSTTLAGSFSRFHQGDASVQRRYGGTGLGLEISRTLAQLMGGTIDVASTLGQGSVFTLELPLHCAQPAQASSSLASASQSSLHILIADDHPVNVKYLRILLHNMGHTVSTCENGALALAQLQQQHFDVVLMDFHMPEMDGLTATRAIRQLGGDVGQTPIIMVSADILNNTRQSALDAGANEFIAKPLLMEGLRQAMGRCTAPGSHTPAPALAAQASPTPAANAPWVDPEVFLGFVDLMPASTVEQQLQALFHHCPSEIDLIASALAQGQIAKAVQQAHKLKGACMLMGLTALTRSLEQLEVNPADSAALLEQLQHQVQQTRLALAPLYDFAAIPQQPAVHS